MRLAAAACSYGLWQRFAACGWSISIDVVTLCTHCLYFLSINEGSNIILGLKYEKGHRYGLVWSYYKYIALMYVDSAKKNDNKVNKQNK